MSAIIKNCEPLALNKIPLLEISDFRNLALLKMEDGGRIVSFFAKTLNPVKHRLYMVIGFDKLGELHVFSTDVENSYLSLTPSCSQAFLFEREIFEEHGITPINHPWNKPVRFIEKNKNKNTLINEIGITDFYSVTGEEIHEVAVGPVHAGIIEPGHFRFQCNGENVLHLEISLGYQHRGIENNIKKGPNKKTLFYMESAAGDTSIGHSLAYSQGVEALRGDAVSLRTESIRGVMLELERLANHTGDLGALANDVGYLPTASYCGRIRGDFLNLSALICGNRFGRGMVFPGGVNFELDDSYCKKILINIDKAYKDVENAVELLWNTPSVVDRFENTGVLDSNTGYDLGIVGVAARASNIDQDVRYDFPSGIYRMSQIPISTYYTGDVLSRAFVRWLEIKRSVDFIKEQLSWLPQTTYNTQGEKLKPEHLVVSLVEGWRGEICHTIITDNKGNFADYKIVDPSFHNWIGLAMVMRGEQISNFPLCNKSFNLSYCGQDL